MPFTRADVLSAAQRSLAAAGAHDRAGWIGLFTADARVEDPVGSRPHRGHVAIGRFYDTFIGPRDISFRPDTDIVVGTTVLRDLELEIQMAPTVTLHVPTYIRYDLRDAGDELKIAALSAYWELPAMIGQFARGGLVALPAGASLARTMAANQHLAGTLGFLGGFRGLGSGARALFTTFLDDARSGNEVGMRRLIADSPVTRGDDEPVSPSELVRHLSGSNWTKLIVAGNSVAARIERDGRPSVLIGETARAGWNGAVLRRIRLFGGLD
ncbi:nuclear transport factor 2 family protein [Mycobacterium sp. 4D054]|uniref:nuclear transport factor 2 family protein n=1 Tax=Mycobacterium sp. 4D054 TaxID=3457440 RepID=UPI003FD419F3